MRRGVCPKCGSGEIRTAISGFYSGQQRGLSLVGKALWGRSDTDDYVCLGCGYFEQYLRPGKPLTWIAAHWTAVPRWTRTPVRDHMAMRDAVPVQDQIPKGYGVQDRVPEGFEPHGLEETDR